MLVRIARGFAHTVLLVIVFVLGIVLAALCVGRTEWGKARLLAVALPKIQGSLGGKLSVGRLEGDLMRTLVAYDLALDDAEGQPAIRARRLEVHFALLSLLFGAKRIEELRGEGVWLGLHMLADDRFNLATLTAPRDGAEPPKPLGKHTRFVIAHAVFDADLRYQSPSAPAHLQVIEATVHVEGAITIDGPVIVSLDRIDGRIAPPLASPLHARGKLVIEEGHLRLEKVAAELELDEHVLPLFVPSLVGLGPSPIQIRADGPVSPLALALNLQLPRLATSLDANLSFAGVGVAWTARAHATAAELATTGRLDWHGHGDVSATLDVSELSRLSNALADRLVKLGVPRLAGRMDLRAKASVGAGALRVDAEAHAERLTIAALPSLHIGRLAAHVSMADLAGEAHVTASGVHAGTLLFDQLTLKARGNRKMLALDIDAHGPLQTRFALVARGEPAYHAARPGHPAGTDALVEGTLVLKEGLSFATTSAARLHVGASVAVDGLRIASGTQRLALDGSYRLADGAFEVSARGDKIDAAQLAPILRPGHALPKTDLRLDARAHGTRSAPIVDARLAGRSIPDDKTGTPEVDAVVTGHYAAHRASGDIEAHVADSQTLKAHVDVPLRRDSTAPLEGDVALALSLDAASLTKLQLAKITSLLPVEVRGARGKLSARLAISGTPRSPRLSGTAHLLTNDDSTLEGAFDLKLAYEAAKLDVSFATQLAPLGGEVAKRGGALDGDAHLTVDLANAWRTPSELVSRLGVAPFSVELRAKELDLARVPFDELGVDTPIYEGRVSGVLGVTGNVEDPTLHAHVDARGLAGERFDRTDVVLDAGYDDGRATVDGKVTLRGTPLFTLRGGATLATATQKLDRAIVRRWREVPVTLEARVPGYSLALLPDVADKIAGVVKGELTLDGTIAHPEARAKLGVDGLRVGDVSFGRFEGSAAMKESVATVLLDASARTGTLHLAATLPFAAAAPWRADLAVHDFPLDVHTATLPGLRTLEGTLNAGLELGGTRAVPTLSGFARIDHGAMAFEESPIDYKNIALDVALSDGALTLRTLEVGAGDGTLKLAGTGKLAGLLPVSLDVTGQLRNYPVALAGVNAILDARLALKGGTPDGPVKKGFSGHLMVTEGQARVPNLSHVKSVQSLATPAGLVLIDPAGRRAAAARVAKKARQRAKVAANEAAIAAATPDDPPPAYLLGISVPGPFHVKGREVDATLKSELTITLVDSQPAISGVIASTGGSIDLLGRRYDLELVNVDFDGSPNIDPQLDVRISRTTDITIVVEVQGSASDYDVIFSSLPPVYSEEQVMAMILSGNPGAAEVSDQSMEEQVAGALSSTFVGQLKDQLLPSLPIDVVKVDLEKDAIGGENTRLEVGKFLTESVYVSYIHQLGAAVGLRRLNQNQLQIEYRFAKHFELETSFGDAGVGALDFYWSRRF